MRSVIRLVAAGLILGGGAAIGFIVSQDRAAVRHPPPSGLTAEDRAVAVGLLLDSPRSEEAIEHGLVVAERLRRRYGIDTGNRVEDREEAARRARRDVLEGRQFSEEEIVAMARSLGYSLEPESCRTTCENVRNLAVIELKKLALEAVSENRPPPGLLPAPSADRPPG